MKNGVEQGPISGGFPGEMNSLSWFLAAPPRRYSGKRGHSFLHSAAVGRSQRHVPSTPARLQLTLAAYIHTCKDCRVDSRDTVRRQPEETERRGE